MYTRVLQFLGLDLCNSKRTEIIISININIHSLAATESSDRVYKFLEVPFKVKSNSLTARFCLRMTKEKFRNHKLSKCPRLFPRIPPLREYVNAEFVWEFKPDLVQAVVIRAVSSLDISCFNTFIQYLCNGTRKVSSLHTS